MMWVCIATLSIVVMVEVILVYGLVSTALIEEPSSMSTIYGLMASLSLMFAIPLIVYVIIISWRYYKSDIVGKALRDPLTGCFNRNYFNEFYLEQVRLYNRFGHDFAVAMLDIDYFKTVNDEYGHDIGDMVLKEVVQHIRSIIRSSDILARFGGEEFVLLFPGLTLKEAEIVVKKIRSSIDIRDDFSSGHITVSIGVANISSEENITIDVLKEADKYLYKAKETGRNRVCIRHQDEV